MTDLSGLPYLTIESPEDLCVLEHDDKTGAVTGMSADPSHFPSADWAQTLDRVMEAFDEAQCDFARIGQVGEGGIVPLCSNAVGWVLHEDDDEPHRSGVSWRYTTLVWSPEGIAVVCEDCAPETMYAAAADARARG